MWCMPSEGIPLLPPRRNDMRVYIALEQLPQWQNPQSRSTGHMAMQHGQISLQCSWIKRRMMPNCNENCSLFRRIHRSLHSIGKFSKGVLPTHNPDDESPSQLHKFKSTVMVNNQAVQQLITFHSSTFHKTNDHPPRQWALLALQGSQNHRCE